ncbi:MAG: PAS domain S-box protein [Candidatus Sumerlaeota bacterium]|nr:PAS domain S-box protein [Candidatus Sumerlaeota bacterium]
MKKTKAQSKSIRPTRQEIQDKTLEQARLEIEAERKRIAFLEQAGDNLALALAQRQASEALRESEERYRSLVEAAPDVIYTISGEDGTLTSLNPAFEAITGWPRAQWLGKPFASLVHPEDLPLAEETFQKALNGQTLPIYELRILAKSGEYLVGEFTSTPQIKDGKVVGELGIVRDITERKRAEEALKKSAQLLRDTGELAKVGGWELDLSTQEVLWTEEVFRIHGVESGYKPKLEEAKKFYAPEFIPALEAALKKVAETGEPYDLESLFIPSGSKEKIWVRSLGKAVYSGGKIVKLAGIFQNIDKYKRTAETLRESEERLRASKDLLQAIVDNTPALVYVFDREEHLLVANKAIGELVGRSPSELLGKRRHEFLPLEIAERDEENDRQVIQAGASRQFEEAGIFQGKAATFLTVKFPLRHEHGVIWGIGGVSTDITERKRAEEALREREEFSRALFEHNPIETIVVDREGKVTMLNLARKRSGDRLPNIGDVMYQDYAGKHERDMHGELMECIQSGQSKEFPELKYRQKYLSITISPFPKGAIIISQDVTARKRTEAALRLQSEIAANISEGLNLVRASDGAIIYTNTRFEQMFGYGLGELIGKHISVVNAPTNKSPEQIASEIMEILNRTGVWHGEKQNIKKDGAPFWCYTSISKFDHPEYGKVFISVHMDITERKRAEEMMQAQRDLLLAIGLVANLDEMLSLCLEMALRISGMDSGGIYLREEGSGGLRLAAHRGLSPAFVRGASSYGSDSPNALLVLQGRPAYMRHHALAATLNEAERREGLRALGVIPILNNEQVIGCMNVASHTADDVPARARTILETIAYQIGPLIARAKAEERLRESTEKLLAYQSQLRSLALDLSIAEERERRRIASYLHDQIGQSLALMRMKIGALKEATAPAEIAELTEAIRIMLEETIQDMRSLTLDLSPPILYELGLSPALEWLGEKFSATHGRKGDQVLIEIEDGGVGFDVRQLETRSWRDMGFGLFSIRERITHIGGRIEIESRIGQGTRIVLMAPLKKDEDYSQGGVISVR